MKLFKITIIIVFLFTFIGVNAQDVEINVAQEDSFVTPDTWPAYSGGDDARIKYLATAISYPKEAKEANEQGTVYVTFVVEKDGSISNVKVLRGVSPSLDKEAVRAIMAMPNWSPAEKDGEAVRCQFNMPIKFILMGGSTNENKKARKEKRALKKAEKAEAKNG